MTSRVRGRLVDVSNVELAIVEHSQLTNLIDWLFQLKSSW